MKFKLGFFRPVTEIAEVAAAAASNELKKRWSYFIRKVYETDSLICPKCQGEMWFDKLTTLRKPEGRIISFIDQPEVIKKILPVCVRARTGRQHLGLWENSHAPHQIAFLLHRLQMPLLNL